MKNKTFLWVAVALTLGFLFAACENPAKPTDPSGDAVADYLAQAAGGGSAADPVSLAVTLELTAAAWQGLLQTIADAGKFVALDISESTLERGGTEFDPPHPLRAGGTS